MNAMTCPTLIHTYPVSSAARIAAAGDRTRKKPQAASLTPTSERLLGRRILIVEDEALLALELQLAFEDEGAEVIGPALSIYHALDAVTHEREIDVALLDMDIAGDDIYPVAELLRQRGVPFLFHTGHGSRSQLGLLFPGTLTFAKPALPEVLIDHLSRIMR